MVTPIKLYADGADLDDMRRMSANPRISGFTTNPTLMRKAGVREYLPWALEVCAAFPAYPISFEVIADDFAEMERQARILSDLGPNVYVKIPVTDTKGTFSGPLIKRLSKDGIKVNVTAVMTWEQIQPLVQLLDHAPAIISVFAGRMADTGDSTVEHTMRHAVDALKSHHHHRTNIEILWASPRQVLDVYIAERAGVHIITITKDILAKLPLLGKDLEEYSRETVQLFYDDAKAAGYSL